MAKRNQKKSRVGTKVLTLLFGMGLGYVLCNGIFNTLQVLSDRGKMQQMQPPQTPPPFKFELRWLYTPSKSLGLIITLLISYFFGLYIVYKVEQGYKIRHSQDDLHGSSRWATDKELKDNLYVIKEKHLAKAKKSGIPLAYKDGEFFVDCTTTHSLVLGTTRSGKTQTFVLPFIWLLAVCGDIKSKQSIVVNDPKGEIMQNTYNILKKNGYNIVVINLKDTTRTTRFNPCAFICNEYIYAKEHGTDMSKVNDFVSTLCATLVADPTSKEKIWQDAGQSLMEAILLHMLDVAYENNCMEKVSLPALYQFLVEYGTKEIPKGQDSVNALDEIFESLPVGSLAKMAYATTKFAGSGDTRSSIDFTLSRAMNIFGKDEGIISLTSANEINFEDLIDKPTAVFMIVPDDRKTRHPIAALFVEQCYSSLCEYLNRTGLETLPRRVNFILDEFCNMVTFNDMDSKMTVSAGRNILFHLFVQDLTQLDTRYDKMAKTIRTSCNNLIYIYSMDNDTNKFFSETLGSRTENYISYSGNLKEVISNQNYSAIAQPLMRPDELSVLEAGETIVKRLRMYPIKSSFEFFYKKHSDKASLREVCPYTPSIDVSNLFDLELLGRTDKNSAKEPGLEQQTAHSEQQSTRFSRAMSNIQKQLAQDRTPRYTPTAAPPPPPRTVSPYVQQHSITIKDAMELVNQITHGQFGDAFGDRNADECVQLIRRAKMQQPNPLPQEYAELLIDYVNRFSNKDIKL